MTTTDEKDLKKNEEKETKKKSINVEPKKEGVAQMTFPEFYGYAMGKIMADKKLVGEVIKELQMWYNAQPLDDRSRLARDVSVDLEKGGMIAQALFTNFRQIAMADLTNPPQTP